MNKNILNIINDIKNNIESFVIILIVGVMFGITIYRFINL